MNRTEKSGWLDIVLVGTTIFVVGLFIFDGFLVIARNVHIADVLNTRMINT